MLCGALLGICSGKLCCLKEAGVRTVPPGPSLVSQLLLVLPAVLPLPEAVPLASRLFWNPFVKLETRSFPFLYWPPPPPAGLLGMSGWGLVCASSPGVSSPYILCCLSSTILEEEKVQQEERMRMESRRQVTVSWDSGGSDEAPPKVAKAPTPSLALCLLTFEVYAVGRFMSVARKPNSGLF